MSVKQNAKAAPRKRSKRERRNRLVIYIMIIAMLLSSLTAGLAMFI
ncbi:stressosome-associated protein Prli42 [Virgibacillus indicus]|nr:stressosome-associated protein Prli42 [Virgibacillus indicus]